MSAPKVVPAKEKAEIDDAEMPIDNEDASDKTEEEKIDADEKETCSDKENNDVKDYIELTQ